MRPTVEVVLAWTLIAILFVGLPAGCVAFGARELTYQSSEFDPTPCRVDERAARCLHRERGVVERGVVERSGDDPPTIRVRHDDGRRSTELVLEDDWKPARGDRVVLERWNGRFVSVVDLSREERHTTPDWPSGWGRFEALASIVGGVATLLISSYRGLAALRHRRRA